MSAENNGNSKTYQLHPIGYVYASDKEQRYVLHIEEPYRPALKQMGQFSHVMVFWWAEKMDTQLRRNQQSPIPIPPQEPSSTIQRRKILVGIINDYFRISEEGVVSLS